MILSGIILEGWFFSVWQPTTVGNKPDLQTTLHVKFTITNKRMDGEGLMQMV